MARNTLILLVIAVVAGAIALALGARRGSGVDVEPSLQRGRAEASRNGDPRELAPPPTLDSNHERITTEMAQVAPTEEEAPASVEPEFEDWLATATYPELKEYQSALRAEFRATIAPRLKEKYDRGDYIVIDNFEAKHSTDSMGRALPNRIVFEDGQMRLVRLTYEEDPGASEMIEETRRIDALVAQSERQMRTEKSTSR